jgi:5-methylcytosine-specific restriction enzyme subunit McrC
MQSNSIQVFEYSTLKVEGDFTHHHFEALAKYLTENKDCQYYTLLRNAVRFQNYVGVIKVGNLTIEVLPKCDRNQTDDKDTWQRVLLDMLKISLQVEAKTTTHAYIHIRHHSVLETYLHLFLDEVQKLIHHGLVKKYRFNENNETALKGKLLIHKQITKNIVHAERFYVSHQVYDRNNRYNALLYQTLECIQKMNVSISTTRRCQSLLLDFPECTVVPVSEKTFNCLTYDRKTERYKTALDLARIILLNYHPDIAGGHNNILAIMFDMNKLWENYIYHIIKKAAFSPIRVTRQGSKLFWHSAEKESAYLRPDIVIENTATAETIILDTKWKYQSKVSEQDLRQIYAYNHYFKATQGFLVYPDKMETGDHTYQNKGNFVSVENSKKDSEYTCSLLYIDILDHDKNDSAKKILNQTIGAEILSLLILNR